MRILIACEFSGIVREAFKAKGHDSWSCDFKNTEIPGQHIRGNVLDQLDKGWDKMIGFPECKYLCWSGERWMKDNPERKIFRDDALQFFLYLYNSSIPSICLENSNSMFLNKAFRRPDQFVHPYHFGDPFKKTTCLWLKNLSPLVPTNILPIGHRYPAVHQMAPGENRSANRARTYPGIAEAMAEQWG